MFNTCEECSNEWKNRKQQQRNIRCKEDQRETLELKKHNNQI